MARIQDVLSHRQSKKPKKTLIDVSVCKIKNSDLEHGCEGTLKEVRNMVAEGYLIKFGAQETSLFFLWRICERLFLKKKKKS